MNAATEEEKVRVDQWLWAARFFKTRSLAKAAVEGGKVHVDGLRVKPARPVSEGTCLTITRGNDTAEIEVLSVSRRRGPATVARQLYRETDESVARRARRQAEARLLSAGLKVPSKRPEKHARRQLRDLKTHSPDDL